MIKARRVRDKDIGLVSAKSVDLVPINEWARRALIKVFQNDLLAFPAPSSILLDDNDDNRPEGSVGSIDGLLWARRTNEDTHRFGEGKEKREAKQKYLSEQVNIWLFLLLACLPVSLCCSPFIATEHKWSLRLIALFFSSYLYSLLLLLRLLSVSDGLKRNQDVTSTDASLSYHHYQYILTSKENMEKMQEKYRAEGCLVKRFNWVALVSSSSMYLSLSSIERRLVSSSVLRRHSRNMKKTKTSLTSMIHLSLCLIGL